MNVLDEIPDDLVLLLQQSEQPEPTFEIPTDFITPAPDLPLPVAPPQPIPQSVISVLLERREPDLTDFNRAMNDPTLTVNPRKMGFIPERTFPDREVPFRTIVQDFFQRKNHSSCRFIHKLYNAQRLVECDPKFVSIVGVSWVTDKILKINREVFARLLMVKAVEGSLFNKQGNFPSHGFCEVEPEVARSMFPDFDFSLERLLVHRDGIFVRGCTENTVTLCKWTN